MDRSDYYLSYVGNMKERPIHLLIDINIWVRLISEDGKSPNLARLFHLVQKGHVIILCPEALLEEWPRNRDKTRDRHLKEIKPDQQLVNKLKAINDTAAGWSEERLQEFKNTYYQQLNGIDSLIENGLKIPRTEAGRRMIEQLKAAKKAPFHTETTRNTTNDAELIYYSLDYLGLGDWKELYFLSDNTNDFGIKKNDILSLHPDIAAYNPGITVRYHTDIAVTYQAFDRLGLPDMPPGESLEFKKVKNTILVDRQAPLIDQILEYFKKRLEDTPFLPKQLFAEHYPFIAGDFFDSHPRPFTLNVDNQEVYDLLNPVLDVVTGVIGPRVPLVPADVGKLVLIRQYLFDLNIYGVSYRLKDVVRLDDNLDGVRMNTHLSEYRVHDFLCILENITAEDALALTGDIKKDLRKAFAFYKLAHYRGAATLLLKMRKAYKGQRSVPYFICCFNLTRLAQLVRHSYWRDSEAQDLAEQCLGPDLDKEMAEISNPQYRDILDYIHRTKFFSDNLFELQISLNEIRDYHLRQTGGFNYVPDNLLEQYFSTEVFLHENCIVFDRYTEFNALSAGYIEGVLASFGCGDEMFGRMTEFTDDHLIPIIFYGKTEEINNHFERYKVKSLMYKPDKSGSSIYLLVCNILDQYMIINERYGEMIKNEMPEFFDHYIRRLSNSLLVLSVLEMDGSLLEDIARKLLHFLIVQIHVPRGFFTKWARLFLLRNEQKLSSSVWREYFLSILRNKPLHEGMNLTLMSHVFGRLKLSLEMPAEEFEAIIQNFVGKCQLCDEIHTWHDLADIYRSLGDQGQKGRVRDLAVASLTHHFDPESYCMAVVCDMIPADDDMTRQCVDIISGLIETNMKQRAGGGKSYYTDGRLDQLINMCWKLGIDIPEPIQKELPQLGVYYTWISDLEGFDYAGFKPEWLDHSFTMYYKRKFRKSTALKSHLLESILANRNDDHAKIFVIIYGKED